MNTTLKQRVPLLMAALIVATVLGAITYWSGRPPDQSLLVFSVGVVLLVGITLAFGVLIWHLLWRPLPDGFKQVSAETLSPIQRQLLGMLVLIAMLNIVVGGMWDEAWHRTFGVPFGEDLFWRPHIMLYIGFGLVTLLAFASLWFAIRKAQGSLQQRFRSNKLVGMMALLGGYLVIALPADPLWHIIYGEDITAWSLPHLILLVSASLIGILSMAFLLSSHAATTWKTIYSLNTNIILAIVNLTFVVTIFLIVLATEWDGNHDMTSYFTNLQRPDWLLYIMMAGISSWIGCMALHTTRRIGAATVVGVLAFLVRLFFVAINPTDAISLNAWTILLPPLIVLDIGYGFFAQNNQTPPAWVGGLLIQIGIMLGTRPLVSQLYVYPTWEASMLWPVLGAGFCAALGMGWLARQVGDFISSQTVGSEQGVVLVSAENPPPQLRFIVPIAFASVLIFIVLFILTAEPPV